MTIPIAIREQLGLRPGSEVQFDIDGDAVRITKASDSESYGQRLVARMRGKATAGLSTDEIMALTRGE